MVRHQTETMDGALAQPRAQPLDQRRGLARRTTAVLTGPPQRLTLRCERLQFARTQLKHAHWRRQREPRQMLGVRRGLPSQGSAR